MKNTRWLTRLTKAFYSLGLIFVIAGLLLSAIQTPAAASSLQTGGGGGGKAKLSLEKTADKSEYSQVGEVITYTYKLTNTGDVELKDLWVNDDKLGWIDLPGKLAKGESKQTTRTYTVQSYDIGTNKKIVNNALGYATNKSYKDVTSNNDKVTVTYKPPVPGLSLTKTASPTTFNAVGQWITYTYTLTNTGETTLNAPFSISDNKIWGFWVPGVPQGNLTPGQSATATAMYQITIFDLMAGSVTNTACGYAKSGYTSVSSSCVNATVTASYNPSLSLTKSVSPTRYLAEGDELLYTYVVTNTGDVPLTDISITDNKISGAISGPSTLAVGASTTLTATYSVTAADVTNGSVTNTATASGTFNGQSYNSNPAQATATADKPALTLEKSVEESTYDEVGDALHYSYVVTNTGNVDLTNITIDDDKIGTISGPAALAVGASETVTGTYTVTQADLNAGSVTNVAQAFGSFGSVNVPSNTDTATVNAVQSTGLTLVKTALTASYDSASDVLEYSYLVTNTGNVTLTGIYVSDDKISSFTGGSSSLAPGESTTFYGSYTTTQDDVDDGSVVNNATAHGYNGAAKVDSNKDDAQVFALTSGPSLALTKSVSSATYSSVGDVLTYTYELRNTGSVTLYAPFSVSDDKLGTLSGSATTLLPGATTTITETHTITQADLDAGEIYNEATANAKTKAGGDVLSNEDDATVTAEQTAELTLVKAAEQSEFDEVGAVLDYTYTLTNSGNVTLSGPFTIDDDKIGTLTSTVESLAPGAYIEFEGSYTVTQDDYDELIVTNKATGHGYFGDEEIDSNEDSATVTGKITGPGLNLVKSATESTYSLVGDVIHYTYTLKNIGDVTLWGPFKVFDDKSVDETCTLSSASDKLLPGAETTCTATYTITANDLSAGSVTNIAYAQAFYKGNSVLSGEDRVTVEADLISPVVTITGAQEAVCALEAGTLCIDFTVTVSGLTFGSVEFFPEGETWLADDQTTVFTEDGEYIVTVCADWQGIEDIKVLEELILNAYADWTIPPVQQPQLLTVVPTEHIATGSGRIYYDPESELTCFPLNAPTFGQPFCSLDGDDWKQAVNLRNPNDRAIDITWTVDGGESQSATIEANDSIRLGNFELGSKPVIAVYWGEEGFIELRPNLSADACYTPEPEELTITSIPVTAYSIPVTGGEPAPVTEAVVLIPVTGADLGTGNAGTNNFVNKLLLNVGLGLLGLAFIAHSVRSKFLK